MVMSRVADWTPVFPEPEPDHWVALVSTRTQVAVRSDVSMGARERRWLADWLSRYVAAEPDLPASYVYLGLSAEWTRASADGRTSAAGVTGVGSGEGFGEPPDALTSTTREILDRSIVSLRSA